MGRCCEIITDLRCFVNNATDQALTGPQTTPPAASQKPTRPRHSSLGSAFSKAFTTVALYSPAFPGSSRGVRAFVCNIKEPGHLR